MKPPFQTRAFPLFLGGLFVAVLPGAARSQESQTVLDSPTVQLTETDVPFRRLFDFDADGDLDAVGIYPHQNDDRFRAAVYENDGQGLYTEVWSASVALYVDSFEFLIEVGRLNDDDFDDACIMTGRKHFELLSSGNGAFTMLQSDLFAQVRALTLADVSGDGIDDHVFADRDALRVLVQGVELSVPDGVGIPETLRVLDADGDPFPDVLVSFGVHLHFFHGSPTGLVPGADYNHGLSGVMVDVGDIDGDLDTDVVAFKDGLTPTFRVLRRTGASAWSLEPARVGGPAEFLRDVDGDGDLDGVCCGGGGGAPPYLPNDQRTDFQISLNDGTGDFAPAFQIEGLGSPQIAGVADVDGDGDADLVAGRCVYFARGAVRKPVTAEEGFDMPVVASRRDVADLDQDGDPDLGLCLHDVWVNDGHGFFQHETPSMPAAPANTAFRGPGFPGDFDGDGFTDLLVDHVALPRGTTPGGASGSMARMPGLLIGARLLRNDGSGAFLDGGPATIRGAGVGVGSLEARASVLGDLDLDGDLDLVSRSMSFPAASQLWLNGGSGFFVPLTRIEGERVEHVADLDLDGVSDLVTTHPHQTYFAQQTLGILHGSLTPQGFPGYADVSELLLGLGYPIDAVDGGVSFGDVNGDGYLDMGIVAYPGSLAANAQLVIDRQGFGETGYLNNVAIDPGYDLMADASVALGDLDGDGALDALIGRIAGAPNVSVVRLKYPDPSWFFRTSVAQIAPTGVPVDVDGDGDLDVVGDSVVFNVLGE